jgi:hypothetical protein
MPTNLDRADWAASALRHFQSTNGTEHDDALPDLLCDLMHCADARNYDFDAALHTARMHYQAECEDENSTVRLPQAVRDLVDAFELQTERARAVIDSWEQGDLAGAVHGLEMSLDDSLAAVAKVKGGAA